MSARLGMCLIDAHVQHMHQIQVHNCMSRTKGWNARLRHTIHRAAQRISPV